MEGFVLIDAGLSDYEAVYASQLALVQKKRQSPESCDYLILCEHPDVYTYGRKSKAQGVAIEDHSTAFFVERGGEVTFHNPGQLVAYPILALREYERDVHRHLRRLEDTLIDVLGDWGLKGERREALTGVWLRGQKKKIASIGIAVTSWVTFHGAALNVCNALEGFRKVNPCGLSPEVMTSMAEQLGEACPTMEEVKASFLRHFSKSFERTLVV